MSELPRHVLKYLEKNDVDPNDLSDDAKATLAGLSVGELALLKFVKNSMKDDKPDVILRVH